jgi:nudix-type nucleoside diphosphatase (YffH/AdpP family)
MTTERIRIKHIEELGREPGTLTRTTLDYLRSDGRWVTLQREQYDSGGGVTVLLYNRKRRTVVLTRQFRFPAFASGHDGFLLESPAGMLDGTPADVRVCAEAMEETGIEIVSPQRLYRLFMSPGSVKEEVHFFCAEYRQHDRKEDGGGLEEEGEDIEVTEMDFDQALAKVGQDIVDAKTVILLQHAALHIFR